MLAVLRQIKVWIWLRVAKSWAEATQTTKAQCTLSKVLSQRSTASWSETDFSCWNLASTSLKKPAMASFSQSELRVASTMAGSFCVMTQSSWSVSSDQRACRKTFVSDAPGCATAFFRFQEVPRETEVILDSMLSREASLGSKRKFQAVTAVIGTFSWSSRAT